MSKLKFGKGNAKLDGYKKPIYTFSLPAGFTCPGAKECKSQAKVDKDGKRYIKDGRDTKFRCFAASQEVQYTPVYEARRHNLNLLRNAKTVAKMSKLISDSLPPKAEIIRVHVSGDFFSQTYFNAWIGVAKANPSMIFYAYTKSLPYVIRNGSIPANFRLTASYGGRYDTLIPSSGLRSATVIYSEKDANGLPIDKDDSHAIGTGGSFALLLHGTQPAGTEAASALIKLRGKGSYPKRKTK